MVAGKRPIPTQPKLYHIVHFNRLQSIVADEWLWSHAEVNRRGSPGTTIGIADLKDTRLTNPLNSHSDLYVGECVPFYFCPRSVMLHSIYVGNPKLGYREGQAPIVHLQTDLRRVVEWAEGEQRRWAFTSSNAGSRYFEDYSDLEHLDRINWDAVEARYWSDCKEEKQAEFLVEHSFPWHLVEFIGVHSAEIRGRVRQTLEGIGHQPVVEVVPAWYY